MARTQNGFYPEDEVYRAVVSIEHKPGQSAWVTKYGPYATAATAKTVGTRKTAWAKNQGRVTRVVIQKAILTWSDVDV